MTASVNAVVVDDDERESRLLVELLNARGDDLRCEALMPKSTVEQTAKAALTKLPATTPRVLLLDYRLGEHEVRTGSRVTYRGGTVAGYVRDEDPDLPIVLLTSESKLHEWVARRPGMEEHFDWTLLKKDIATPDAGVDAHARLVDYALAWHAARGWPDDPGETWKRLGGLMAAPPDGLALFSSLEAEPPRGDSPGSVLRWLYRSAHRVSGPLVNGAGARVILGLAESSFATPQLQAWLEPARYTGALRSFGERWWAHLVREQLAGTCEGTRPAEATARADALARQVGVELKSEQCSWCDGERTLHACLVCGRATDAAHCLRPLTPPLPAWADPTVVCYSCIAEGRAERDGLHFPPSVGDVVDGLIEDRIRPPR